MSVDFELETPLPGARFGGRLRCKVGAGAQRLIEAAQRQPEALPGALTEARGLLLIAGLEEIADDPQLLLHLSRLFGPEIENYRQNLTLPNQIHETVPEILLVSNMPPCSRMPPAQPDPRSTIDGDLPTQFPHRKGWHTDQSYRRPPPDISLFYAVSPVRRDQGQTIFADGAAAYEALPAALKARVDRLEGLHASSAHGRNRDAVLRGEVPRQLRPHELSQRQPLARLHPVTGRRALYLCESGQMDFVDGPIIGMQPGPNGDGAALLFELMAHATRRDFIYVHEWTRGDLLVWDNRCLVHCATWYDAANEQRLMWRTTVRGNPDPLYAGEKKSWIPATAAE
ncbi:MAG: TauD/TfdA family dioxygenase [Alphaproteobacteria bacterium]|nr:TauD/TfdA family dioxygenase [Alphaproteobacteria bacterium]